MSEESNEFDENLSIDDIVKIIKKHIREHRIIVIGFCLRHEENLLDHLININNNYHEFSNIINPLLENDECNDGDISFELINDIVHVTICPMDEYIGEHNMSTKIEISIEIFNSFCDIVKDFAIFMSDDGETLLTDI